MLPWLTSIWVNGYEGSVYIYCNISHTIPDVPILKTHTESYATTQSTAYAKAEEERGGESGRVRHGHITLSTTGVLLPEEYPVYLIVYL